MPLTASFADLSRFVNEQNKSYWDQVITSLDIEIKMSSSDEHGSHTQRSKAIIYVPSQEVGREGFTHELLHVYLFYKEAYVRQNLQLQIGSSNILSKIFVPGLCEHIANSLAHVKMLPLYLEMGFAAEKFLLDYAEIKCTKEEIKKIRQLYKNGKTYTAEAIEEFIGKYFAMQTDPNENHDYDEQLTELSQIDAQLYDIFESYLDTWDDYDIEAPEKTFSYRDMNEQMYNDMKKWMTNKKIEKINN